MLIRNLKEDLKEYENKYVVYMLTSPNNKKYCGYSHNIKRRWSRNGNEYKDNEHLSAAIKKYGWDHIIKEILYSFDNSEEALQKEAEIIEKYHLLDPNIGYNKVPGGGNPPHGLQYVSEEGYKKMQENGKRLANEVWNNPEKRAYTIQRMKEENHKARMQMTPEQRKKSYGERNIGRTPPNAKPIYQLDYDTLEIINEYPSSYEAAKQVVHDADASKNIRAVAGGKRKSAYGYRWRWKEE